MAFSSTSFPCKKHRQIVCMRHEASEFLLFIGHAASVEQASTTKWAMNFNSNFLTFPIFGRIFRQVCRKQDVKHQPTKHACSRNQHDIFLISCNIICKFFIVGCQHVKSTCCTVSRGIRTRVVYQFPPTTATDEQIQWTRTFSESFSYICAAEWHHAYHRATLNKTLLESKRFQARFLVLQAKEKDEERANAL